MPLTVKHMSLMPLIGVDKSGIWLSIFDISDRHRYIGNDPDISKTESEH